MDEVLREQGGAELLAAGGAGPADGDPLARRGRPAPPRRSRCGCAAGRRASRASWCARSPSWFQLVNVAEKVHRIRRRREYFQQDSDRPQPGGVEDALSRTQGRGPEPAGGAGAARRSCRSSRCCWRIRWSRRGAPACGASSAWPRCCSSATTRTLAPNEQRALLERIRTEVSADWQTEEHPRERLTVADEREHAIFYLAEILYRDRAGVLPGDRRRARQALRRAARDASSCR